ncbi:hypothetical protein C8F01DRAFT_1366805 [Mycena amicta]|nr:hypothetical protein C8F01DRAFT_1366805 [Mycena amicta]
MSSTQRGRSALRPPEASASNSPHLPLPRLHLPLRNTSPDGTLPPTTSTTNDARFLSRHIEFRGPSLDIDRAGTPIFEEDSSDSDDGRLKPSTYRKEERQGWSGEWTGVGAGGMDDVVARLRGMKTK